MLDSIEQAVMMSISHFLETRHHVEDLELCIVVSESRMRFITSDDPAIHTNRYHIQKLRHDAFGLSSSGAMLFLPLTPALAFLAFDGNVYFAPDRRVNIVTLERDAEVSAINELQILHARQNIYYGDAATGETLVADVRRFVSKRPEVWTELIYFKKTGETNEGEKYERVEALNFDGSGEHVTFVEVSPSPGVVRTGTGAGTVRPDDPILHREGIRPPSFAIDRRSYVTNTRNSSRTTLYPDFGSRIEEIAHRALSPSHDILSHRPTIKPCLWPAHPGARDVRHQHSLCTQARYLPHAQGGDGSHQGWKLDYLSLGRGRNIS